jgi:hypothetical protein
MYHISNCYDEFVEIAYLTTPFSYRHNRIARPGDTFATSLIELNLLTSPIHHIRHESSMNGCPLFLSNENSINIYTPFSMYLYGIEPEYIPKMTDETGLNEVEVDGDIFYEQKIIKPNNPVPVELLITSYDSD